MYNECKNSYVRAMDLPCIDPSEALAFSMVLDGSADFVAGKNTVSSDVHPIIDSGPNQEVTRMLLRYGLRRAMIGVGWHWMEIIFMIIQVPRFELLGPRFCLCH